MHRHTRLNDSRKIRSVTVDDEHLSILSEYVLYGWPSMTAELQKELQPSWSLRDEIVIIAGITIKSK